MAISSGRRQNLLHLAVLLLLIVVPIFLGRYEKYLLTLILMWGLYALGFDIIFGKTGLLNFGMSAFIGMGSYGYAWSVYHLGVNIWLGLVSALLLSTVFAYLSGLLITRFKSHYFVVFTIVISMILYFLFMNLREYTGGDMGILLRVREVPLGFIDLPLRDRLVKYYVVLFVTGLTFYCVWRFFKSPLGRAIVAVKENEERAAVIGYNPKQLKLISFTLSGMVSGLAGGLYSVINNSTNADLFFWIQSGKAVMFTVVGGAGTLWGSFLGAGLLTYGEDVISTWKEEYYLIVVGVLLIVTILVAPKGIVGSIQVWLNERRLQKDSKAGAA